jgi:hypothetical protein
MGCWVKKYKKGKYRFFDTFQNKFIGPTFGSVSRALVSLMRSPKRVLPFGSYNDDARLVTDWKYGEKESDLVHNKNTSEEIWDQIRDYFGSPYMDQSTCWD